MKKTAILLVFAALLLCASACGDKKTEYRYGFKEMRQAFWENDIVYNESVLLIKDGDKQPEGSLMFTPKSIVSVRDYSLETEYAEGRDWEFKDGRLRMLPGGKMPYLPLSQLVAEDKAGLPPEIKNPRRTKDGTGWLLFSESAFITMRQISVTYTYDNGEWDGPRPEYQGDRLPLTTAKLDGGQGFRMLFFGDSIFVGASATAQLNCPPFMPRIGDLVKEYFVREYGSDVEYINTSKGGQTSRWGVSNAEELAAGRHPDLVFVGFGMNDGSTMQNISVAEYKRNIQTIIDTVRAENPACEFVLVGSMLANELDVACGLQAEYTPALRELAEENGGVAVVAMAEMHAEMLKRKRFIDLSGNNVNHPNDFMIRAYLMSIVSVFER